ncbi:hypothetical protein ACFLZ7_01915 [Nanoarchaeota archaeon]
MKIPKKQLRIARNVYRLIVIGFIIFISGMLLSSIVYESESLIINWIGIFAMLIAMAAIFVFWIMNIKFAIIKKNYGRAIAIFLIPILSFYYYQKITEPDLFKFKIV